jgi:hypothetical protein
VRGFLQTVVVVLASLIAFIGLGTTFAWWAAGTPRNTASTVVSVVDSADGARVVGGLLLDNLLEMASPQERQRIDERRPELVDAAAAALREASAQVRGLVEIAADAIASGQTVTVDVTPVFNGILARFHAIDPEIPAAADEPMVIEIKGADVEPATTGLRALSFWWAALLLAIALFVGAAFIGKHGRWRRWRGPAIGLGVVALLWGCAGLVVPGVVSGFADDPLQSQIIREAAGTLTGKILVVTVPLLVLSVAVVVWSVVDGRKQSRRTVDENPLSESDAGPPSDHVQVPV